ncbi:MAG: MBL fold metallo-hydrolase [Lachnospiraceae bacterium]|nr:MBL fold metallo-hydrolase [Lachnospiraceae bacterium]
MNIDIMRLVVGPIRTNCYLIKNKLSDGVIIVDPGGDEEVIENRMLAYHMKPVAILLTHGHFDHIGAVNQLKSRFGVKVYAYQDEKEVLERPDINLSSMFERPMSIKADVYLRDNEEFELDGIKFKTIYTPGHTIGSCCFYIENEKVLFSGDTLFAYSHGRTDFPTGSEGAIIRSITERLLKLESNVKVYPGHEDETTIGREKMFYVIN